MSRVLRLVLHVMIVEDDLVNNDLSRFDLICLPYMPLLSRDKQQALINYAEEGGTLLLLGKCGTKDQYNVTLDEIPLAMALGNKTYHKTPLHQYHQENQGIGQRSAAIHRNYLSPRA